MDPDELFEEPWSIPEENAWGLPGSEQVLEQSEQLWREAVRLAGTIQRAREKMEAGVAILDAEMRRMDSAQDEVLGIEQAAAETEKEIESKKKAQKVLEDLVEKVCVPEETLSSLQDPWLEKPEELRRIEQALSRAQDVFSVTNSELLSVPAVSATVERVRKALTGFAAASQKYLIEQCTKKKRSAPDELHEVYSRYATIIEYLGQAKKIQPVLDRYAESVSKLYGKMLSDISQKLALSFKKGKQKEKGKRTNELAQRVEQTCVELLLLVFDNALNEAYFLEDVLLPGADEAQNQALLAIFQGVDVAVANWVSEIYSTGCHASLLNLLRVDAEWEEKCTHIEDESRYSKQTISRALAFMHMEVQKLKSTLRNLQQTFLKDCKRTISKEYAKEGPIDLDKTYFDIVDCCAISEVNTEVARLNLAHATRMEKEAEKVFQLLQQASVLAAMHAHILERREYFDPALGSVFEKEMDRISKEFVGLAQQKVFEKDKLSSILKRVRELMSVLCRIEGPLGFQLQIEFKDMVISSAGFQQRNEIAKVLSENTEDPPKS